MVEFNPNNSIQKQNFQSFTSNSNHYSYVPKPGRDKVVLSNKNQSKKDNKNKLLLMAAGAVAAIAGAIAIYKHKKVSVNDLEHSVMKITGEVESDTHCPLVSLRPIQNNAEATAVKNIQAQAEGTSATSNLAIIGAPQDIEERKITEIYQQVATDTDAAELVTSTHGKIISNETLPSDLLNEMEERISKPHLHSWIPNAGEFKPTEVYVNKWFNYTEHPLQPETTVSHQPFSLPTIENIGKELHIEIPSYSKVIPEISSEAKLSRDTETLNSLGKPINTNFRAAYGERLPWGRKKITRDIMQNFMDGHNGTLEGVKIDLAHDVKKDTYKIKISGKGEYNHKEIEDIGSGTKAADERKAGGFGEGAKMASIKLLSSFNVPYVKFGSTDWQLNFNIMKKAGTDTEYLYRTLERAKPISGNFIEFETKDKELVSEILKSTDYLYHPGNKDFASPLFENEHFGIKYLGEKNKGNVYMVKQRFEFNQPEQWDNGLDGFTIFFKRKPAQGIITTGRDRTHLEIDDIAKLIKDDYAKTMTDEELISTILQLRETWTSGWRSHQERILSSLLETARDRKLGIKFPENTKYHAGAVLDSEVSEQLKKDGYITCNNTFGSLGMPLTRDLIKRRNTFQPLMPTPEQVRKIRILDEASQVIVDSIGQSKKADAEAFFRPEEASRPTYLYNRSKQEGHNDTLATAIIDSVPDPKDRWKSIKLYAGQWMDLDHLNGSFPQVLATRLHEMCHKFGGDNERAFSLSLTHMLDYMNQIHMQGGETSDRLKCLNKLWNDN